MRCVIVRPLFPILCDLTETDDDVFSAFARLYALVALSCVGNELLHTNLATSWSLVALTVCRSFAFQQLAVHKAEPFLAVAADCFAPLAFSIALASHWNPQVATFHSRLGRAPLAHMFRIYGSLGASVMLVLLCVAEPMVTSYSLTARLILTCAANTILGVTLLCVAGSVLLQLGRNEKVLRIRCASGFLVLQGLCPLVCISCHRSVMQEQPLVLIGAYLVCEIVVIFFITLPWAETRASAGATGRLSHGRLVAHAA
mmetsp:Transcript_56607/g.133292  ORF Transcript_56607/g.133292 Transcript_56607/m.133292 type:complete len:257 (-) Transcript_56607:134-904(-)